MSTILISILAKDIETYIDYKRALGRKFDTEENALSLLDRFAADHAVSEVKAIDSGFIESFLASRPRKRPRSYNHLLGVIRCFFDWLITQERLESSPVHARPRRPASRHRPFLFEPEQVEQILALAAQLQDNPRAVHRSEVYTLIFTLMYGLGLRVGEVSRLCCEDVDMERELLVIEHTKFGKTRLVPFGPRMAQRLSTYLEKCTEWYGGWRPDDPLFSFSAQHRANINPCTITQVFHSLAMRMNFEVPPGVNRPCLHSLRHSFAVETLLGWYRSGVDPGRRLFHLSTFMGHVDPVSTAWYLTITDALLNEANHRFERLAGRFIGEVTP